MAMLTADLSLAELIEEFTPNVWVRLLGPREWLVIRTCWDRRDPRTIRPIFGPVPLAMGSPAKVDLDEEPLWATAGQPLLMAGGRA